MTSNWNKEGISLGDTVFFHAKGRVWAASVEYVSGRMIKYRPEDGYAARSRVLRVEEHDLARLFADRAEAEATEIVTYCTAHGTHHGQAVAVTVSAPTSPEAKRAARMELERRHRSKGRRAAVTGYTFRVDRINNTAQAAA